MKVDVFDKNISKLIDTVYRLREKADKVLGMIGPYLEESWNN